MDCRFDCRGKAAAGSASLPFGESLQTLLTLPFAHAAVPALLENELVIDDSRESGETFVNPDEPEHLRNLEVGLRLEPATAGYGRARFQNPGNLCSGSLRKCSIFREGLDKMPFERQVGRRHTICWHN